MQYILVVHVDEYSLFRSLRVHQGTHSYTHTHMQRTSARTHTHKAHMSIPCQLHATTAGRRGALRRFPLPPNPAQPGVSPRASSSSQKPEPRGVGHPHGPSVRMRPPARSPPREIVCGTPTHTHIHTHTVDVEQGPPSLSAF